MQTKSKASLLERAKQLAPEIVSWRRAIHQRPELGFQEQQTGRFVADTLKSMGLTVKEQVGGTGVIAEIGDPSRSAIVGLRADMDALPIQEANATEYCSKNEGVMHACGHDAHTACVLGAAQLLLEQHQQGGLPGRVRLLFQPAEETVNADNKSGAALLIEAGALKDLGALVGLHVFPGMPAGFAAIASGPVLAACHSFEVTIKGKGCHGAMPEQGIDAIILGTHAVQAMQTVVSRRLGANEIGALTVGGFRSNTYAANVVADSVEMTGTFRYFSEHLGEFFRAEINRALSVVEALGGTFSIRYRYETPVLNNDEKVSEIVRSAIVTQLGEPAVHPFPPLLGAEDFSFYTAHVPSCFYGLGVGIAGSPRELHSPTFDIDESALPLGSATLAQSALALLAQS